MLSLCFHIVKSPVNFWGGGGGDIQEFIIIFDFHYRQEPRVVSNKVSDFIIPDVIIYFTAGSSDTGIFERTARRLSLNRRKASKSSQHQTPPESPEARSKKT